MSTDNFLVTEAQLALGQARKEKAERTKTLGEPIDLPGKALAIEVRDGVAWIAENTTVIRKLDLESGKTLQIFKGHTGPVTALAFCDRTLGSGDREILISGSWDKSIKFWDISTKELISSTPDAHDDFVKSFLVFPSLGLLVSGSSDKIVRFWDIAVINAAEPLASLGSISSHSRPVECLDGRATSDSTAVLFTGDTMGVIKVWHLKKDTGMPPRWAAILKETINNHRTRINELWYGNGQLWTASADDTVQLIPDKTSENPEPKALKPIVHPTAVRAILPLLLTDLGEPYLITGASDVLRVFDVSRLDEPEFLCEVNAHWHDITAIRLWIRKSIGEDGRTRVEPWVISTSLDKTIRKWRLSELLTATPPKAPEPAPTPAVAVTPTNGYLGSNLTDEEEQELAELMGD